MIKSVDEHVIKFYSPTLFGIFLFMLVLIAYGFSTVILVREILLATCVVKNQINFAVFLSSNQLTSVNQHIATYLIPLSGIHSW